MCNRAPPSRDSAATTVTAKTKTTTNAARQDNAVITLERTPCFGQCPVYRVTLKGDGTVVFEGKANVDSTGRRVGRVSSDNVKTLVRFADAIGYFSFADSYATGQGCAPYIADMPHAITSIALTARMKRVDADHGCAAVPRRLSELEAKIDQTSESWRWIGRR
jgi:hypothetical protein